MYAYPDSYIVSRELHFIWQAAGVKRLLFCGVGCQVQGVYYYLAILLFLLMTLHSILQLLNMKLLNHSFEICRKVPWFGEAICTRHKLR
jgi:hypothetical protein